MHFTIPTTEQHRGGGGAGRSALCTVYVVHVDGSRHCVLRYRQFSCLHRQLCRVFGAAAVPDFPAKQLLPLQQVEVQLRQARLERYLQLISHDSRLASSRVFQGFMASAQLESCRLATTPPPCAGLVSLSVFLVSGQRVTVSLSDHASLDHVLETVCAQLGVARSLTYYFGVLLSVWPSNTTAAAATTDSCGVSSEAVAAGHDDVTRPWRLVRRLCDFEAPYWSLHTAELERRRWHKRQQQGESEQAEWWWSVRGECRLLLLTTCWDAACDEQLAADPAALALLYGQRVAAVQWGWITTTDADSGRRLCQLQATGDKRRFVQSAARQPFCGYVQFEPCIIDRPQTGTQVRVAIGDGQLHVRAVSDVAPSQPPRDGYLVTRMRCWRLSEATDSESGGDSRDGTRQVRLSFEYLWSDGRLEWVTLSSHQAPLMACCLQSMVEELVRRRRGLGVSRPEDRVYRGAYQYLSLDGRSQHVAASGEQDGVEDSRNTTSSSSVVLSFSRLSSKLSQKNGNNTTTQMKNSHASDAVHNSVFEDIGDDRL